MLTWGVPTNSVGVGKTIWRYDLWASDATSMFPRCPFARARAFFI